MTLASLAVQLLNGLASASALFLMAAGLSLIFGVTRIVNFAHGSFYMVGVYLAYSLTTAWGGSAPGYWLAVLTVALAAAVLGAVVEILVLRRTYRSPPLFQLLATFAVVLILGDLAHWWWGPMDLFGPRAPGLEGAVTILGRRFPAYDLLLIAVGPLVLLLLGWLLHRTRWGTLIRAATQDREMLGALGVNQAWLFTSAFALGCGLAGLAGALQGPRIPATLALDLDILVSVFVVVVVGGLGSISGAFLAALLISQVHALLIAFGQVEIAGYTISLSRMTLMAEFLVMAIVLIWRPWGLLGKPPSPGREGHRPPVLRPWSPRARSLALVILAVLALVPLTSGLWPYTTILLTEILIAALFAVSLHWLMGPGGMDSFGHAAYFGLGAYGAAWFLQGWALPMEAALPLAPLVALAAAVVFGAFCVRLSGVYLAMLTLAFAQLVWATVYQWDDVTGGSNGLIGLWPAPWLSSPAAYYLLTLALAAAGWMVIRRLVFSPFGYALRAGRDSALRAEAIGIDVRRTQWLAFVVAGGLAGLSGALYAFAKGSIAPQVLGIERSVDGLVMVLLGGLQTLTGPVVGAVAFTWLHDSVARATEYWHALMGCIILALVLLAPHGLAGLRWPGRGRTA
ncbi:MAG: ABC transporter permease [Pigmentiphaga sp.]